MALPVLTGRKTDAERFAGAETTYAIEGLMQDGRALQAGTSHYLGQNFAKAFDVQFQNREGELEYVYATSWGVSTRLVGALVMTHSDDAGLVLPPKLAPIQVVIVPILKAEAENAAILAAAQALAEAFGSGVEVKVDDRDNVSPGWKFNEWELKGVPVRLEIGPKDYEKGQVVLVRRDTGEKTPIDQSAAAGRVEGVLSEMQDSLFAKAKERLDANCPRADSYDEFRAVLDERGGFVFAPWCGAAECEATVSEETKATIRCLPDDEEACPACMVCGRGPATRVPFAKAY